MKVAAWVNVADLAAVRKSLLEKLIDIVLKGENTKLYSKYPLDEIFSSLKESGVDGLELLVQKYTSDKEVKIVKEVMKRYDMPILSIHQSLHSFNNIPTKEIERLCHIAQAFSARVVVLHCNSLRKRIFKKDFIDYLRKLEKKYHITFGIENLPMAPFNIMQKHTWKAPLFSSTLHDSGLSITLDTTHLAQTGEDICKFYASNKEKIVNIHISDFKKHWLNSKLLLQYGTHLSLGKGELPIQSFVELLNKEKYPGLLTMEIDSDIQGLCNSARILKGKLHV